jgi:AraC-like DNA-binding protein
MEIVVRVEGEMLFYVEGDETYSLKSGDVIVVGPSQLHASRSAPLGKGAQMVCQFDLQHYLDPLFAPYAPYLLNAFVPLSKLNKAIHRNKELTNEIYRGIMSIYGESQKRSFGYELAIGNHMKHILLLLLRIGRNEGIFEGAGAAYAPLRHVFDYVEGHVTEKIRLEDACKLANMSYHYFSRYFKKTVGLSFVEFVNYKRLKAAERLLATSQHLTIADIAEQVGIPNVAHFYETFRRVNGCSPAEFKCRLMHRIGSTPSSER